MIGDVRNELLDITVYAFMGALGIDPIALTPGTEIEVKSGAN